MNVKLAIPLIDDIIKFDMDKRRERDHFINAPHILTRLIYYALGMLNSLPRLPK